MDGQVIRIPSEKLTKSLASQRFLSYFSGSPTKMKKQIIENEGEVLHICMYSKKLEN